MEMVIGISYGVMSEAKRNLGRARDSSQEEKNSLNIAKSTLEASSSARLRMAADLISDRVKNVSTRIINIDKVNSGIDYAVRRFQEVDEECASRIKNTGLDFRRSVGLLNSKEKFRVDPFGSIMAGGEKAWDATRTGVSNAWDKTRELGGEFWDENGELITNVAICALEVAAVGLALPAILAMSAVGATVGVIAVGVISAVGAIYSVNTFVDSGIKVVQKLQGKTGDEYTGFNAIQSGIKLVTKDKGKSEDIYNLTAIGVGILTLGTAGTLAGLSKVKNIKAASAVRSLEKTEPLVKNANKVIKLTSKYSNLAKQNDARIIAHANKVSGAGSKETRAFRQAKKSYDASIKYNHIQEGITKNSGKITENLKSAFVGGTATGIEGTVPKGIETFNNLINGASNSTVYNPYLPTVCGFAN